MMDTQLSDSTVRVYGDPQRPIAIEEKCHDFSAADTVTAAHVLLTHVLQIPWMAHMSLDFLKHETWRVVTDDITYVGGP
ncbi:hypothetical protein P7K49_013127 [Saguinus oedipus]|uniref:Uncharacterized protein n=1 Tax=Saguinus oedipus TaxID=9490 RepID=A0ABQ9VHX8_SAGOE|nr:hypothetical protein P7K49_013127 [Saguinus oedipus]